MNEKENERVQKLRQLLISSLDLEFEKMVKERLPNWNLNDEKINGLKLQLAKFWLMQENEKEGE